MNKNLLYFSLSTWSFPQNLENLAVNLLSFKDAPSDMDTSGLWSVDIEPEIPNPPGLVPNPPGLPPKYLE